MMKHFMNILLITTFLSLAWVLVPIAFNYGSSQKFDGHVEEATVEVLQDRNLLYTAFSEPIINHCDATVSIFLTRGDVEVALPVLFVPVEHAKLSFDKTEDTLLSWNIPEGTPPGVYIMHTHVKNDCGMFSGQSVKLDNIKVEITSW